VHTFLQNELLLEEVLPCGKDFKPELPEDHVCNELQSLLCDLAVTSGDDSATGARVHICHTCVLCSYDLENAHRT